MFFWHSAGGLFFLITVFGLYTLISRLNDFLLNGR